MRVQIICICFLIVFLAACNEKQQAKSQQYYESNIEEAKEVDLQCKNETKKILYDDCNNARNAIIRFNHKSMTKPQKDTEFSFQKP